MRIVPAGYSLFASDPALKVEVYRKDLCLKAFAGRSDKGRFHYRFPNETELSGYLSKWLDDQRSKHQTKLEQRAEEKDAVSPLEVGDLIVASWGHDQTNVDYYLVMERIGKKGVTLQQVGNHKTLDQGDRGRCVPDLNVHKGKPFRAKSNKDGVIRLSSYCYASPETYTLDGEKRVYPERYWSSYA